MDTCVVLRWSPRRIVNTSVFIQGAPQGAISTDTPYRLCLMTQTHRRKSRTAPRPHVGGQNGEGKRVWTGAAVPPTTPNWRTGNYEVNGLRDYSLLGMNYDAERWSGNDATWFQRGVGVLRTIRWYLYKYLNFFNFRWCLSVDGIARGVARWGRDWIWNSIADHNSVGGGMIHRFVVNCCR